MSVIVDPHYAHNLTGSRKKKKVYYTFYFTTGQKYFLSGDTTTTAFSRLGGNGLYSLVDFYQIGLDFSYEYSNETRSWKKLDKQPTEVDILSMTVDGVSIRDFHIHLLRKEFPAGAVVPWTEEENAVWVKLKDIQAYWDWKFGNVQNISRLIGI